MALSTEHLDTAKGIARERAAAVVPAVTEAMHLAKEKSGVLLEHDVMQQARRRATDVVRAAKGDPIVAMPSRTWPVALQWFVIGAAAGAAAAMLARRMLPEPMPELSGLSGEQPREQEIEYVRTLPDVSSASSDGTREQATTGMTPRE